VTNWICTPEALAGLVRSLDGCRAVALDTESDSLYHYFDKVCLVQVASDRGETVLVDPWPRATSPRSARFSPTPAWSRSSTGPTTT